MSERSHGRYRGVYTSLVGGPDFQHLSSDARLTFLCARLCPENTIASIFTYYPEVLARQTGLSARRVETALVDLEKTGWIEREGIVLWIRNGLRHDPLISLADRKHLESVRRALRGLPTSDIVVRFCEYYKITRAIEGPTQGPTQGPTKGHRRPYEGANHRSRSRSTLPPTPSPQDAGKGLASPWPEHGKHLDARLEAFETDPGYAASLATCPDPIAFRAAVVRAAPTWPGRHLPPATSLLWFRDGGWHPGPA